MKEEFKVTRVRKAVLYRDSSDPKVANAGIQLSTGRKWKAEEAVQVDEATGLLWEWLREVELV